MSHHPKRKEKNYLNCGTIVFARNFKSDLDKEDRVELAKVYTKQLQKNPADSFLNSRIALLLDTTKSINIDSLGWEKNAKQIISFFYCFHFFNPKL